MQSACWEGWDMSLQREAGPDQEEASSHESLWWDIPGV